MLTSDGLRVIMEALLKSTHAINGQELGQYCVFEGYCGMYDLPFLASASYGFNCFAVNYLLC